MQKKIPVFLILIVTTGVIFAEKKPLTLDSLMQQLQNLKENSPEQKAAVKSDKDIITGVDVRGSKRVPKSLILSTVTIKAGDPLDIYQVKRNVQNIQSLGFFADVTTTFEKEGAGKKLIFVVKENPTLQKIEFEGSTVFAREQLQEAIKSKIDDVFSFDNVRDDVKAIKKLYEDKGYIQIDVLQVKTPEKDGDPLVFVISEGVIEDISVTGNTKTRDYVILREMTLKPGMLLQREVLKEDFRRIYNLNYFTDLQPVFLPGNSANATRLQLQVAERPSSGSFSFGGGYSPSSGFSVFSDLYWDNLFGTGQLIALKGQFGAATTYQFKYHNPWMWDERKSVTFRTWLTDGNVNYISPLSSAGEFRPERRKGVDLALGWPFSYQLRTSHKVKWESVSLFNVGKAYQINSYTFDIAYDTRDVWFNPSEGDYHSFSVEKGLTLTSSSLDFTRYDVSFRKYFKVVDKQTLAARVQAGYIQSPTNDSDIFGAEWYRAGGGDTVRGYDDQRPFAFGNKVILANLEYRLLFTDQFQGIIFLDAGYASNDSITDITKFKVGKGVGIRFNIPGLGPLRLDAGLDEVGVVRIHFNIGHTF